MCADDAFELEDVIFDWAGAAAGLACKDIQPGANAALLDGASERRLINHFGARRVDEVRAGLERREHRFIDEVARVVFEGDVNAEDVTRGGHFLWRRFHFNAEFFSALRCERTAPGDDRHAESACACEHLLANLSKPDQAERAAEQAARTAILFFVPLAGL